MVMLTYMVLSIVFLQSADAKTRANSKLPRKTFVLVHGAWQAPYAWDLVKDDLAKKGHTVIVVELPSHGNDNTPPLEASMNAYRDKVVAAIKNTKGRVILVGHSMAGLVISAVAESIPERIESLVYLGAFLPADGESLMSLTSNDKQSLLGPAIVPSQDQLTLAIKKESLINVFCQDASEKIKELVTAQYKTEPAIPFGDKVTLTSANFGKVRKYYIHTLKDHAVGIDLQRQMVATSNVSKVYSVDSGHLPHLTQPREISKILFEIAD